jgi:hypothetical protein
MTTRLAACFVFYGKISRTAFWIFCNTIGTFRTWRAVRLESVMRFKADMGGMNIAACSSR